MFVPSSLIWSWTLALAPSPMPDGEHDGGDADQDAEHRERGAQPVGADRLGRGAEGVAPAHRVGSSSCIGDRSSRPHAAVVELDRPLGPVGDVVLVGDQRRSCGPRRAGPASRPSTSAVDVESRLPVGSSARIIAGSVTSARAMATRCCWPPDSSPGRWSARSASPTFSSACKRAFAALFGVDARVHEREFDVAPRRQVGEQVELLEHEPDEEVADVGELVLVEGLDVVAGEPERPAGRHVEAAEDVHQRRLARARRAR